MGKGNLLGREQTFGRRQQNRWANVQARDYRAQIVDPLEVLRRREALRVRLAQGGQTPEQVRRAQEDAEAQVERDRLEAEANARELHRLERERIQLLRQQRREADKQLKQTQKALNAQQEQQLKAQQEALRLQQIAQEQAAKDQYENDLETLADIRAKLPLLKTRAQGALRRAEKTQRVLSGTPGANQATAQNSALVLNQIVARCTLAIATVETARQMMMAANINLIETATRQAILGLQQVLTDYAVDDPAATNALADTALIEGTYAASLALMALYPNLGLTHDLIGKATGPTARLSADQLATLNTKLASHAVLSWAQTNLPATRPLGNISCWVPQQLTNFPYQPGGEIFCDWIWPYTGHGFPAAQMLKYLTPISNGTMQVAVGPGFNLTLVRAASQGNYLVTMNNSNTRIVFNNAMTLLITYFIAS